MVDKKDIDIIKEVRGAVERKPMLKMLIILLMITLLFVSFGRTMYIVGEYSLCERMGGHLAKDHMCYTDESFEVWPDKKTPFSDLDYNFTFRGMR